MSASGSRRLRPGEVIALAIALLWSAALLVAALTVPVYESTGAASSGAFTEGSRTLVGENGTTVLVVAAAPLLATIVVATALWLRPARRGTGPLAWTVTGLLAGVNLLAMLTVGVFIVPVTVCLVIACLIHPSGPQVPAE